ncbi:TetR/AcrR family transcriptional regulator [Rhodococcus tukisamuensis]|uniref:DNA-binding transcriptional regulator, AcrR family n=1 Tax=Rhodococcus tukisamuensis TaxID=168276 RepID=A0A1G6QBS1_9NOCA|nr:TetR/AcrR family transcriptional regulator [Rhodococcus tukisamuensis]SDC89809.1 DNA-binding transcriptional regulator, AcrR family [Rhodococcus tukisamuensis]
MPRSRAQTRERLLAAALDVFAEEGFGRSTVEQVCERAGFTRGAFYSNFDSLDELFLAMWGQRSQAMLDGIRDAVAAAEAAADAEPFDLDQGAARILAAIPVEDRWYRITAEFTAHALRNPALKSVMAAREAAIQATILPIVDSALARAGRRITDPQALGRALVAVHDGTSVQVLMEPGDPQIVSARTELFVCVLRNFSENSSPSENK